jgi:biotin carboxyl carrier protein
MGSATRYVVSLRGREIAVEVTRLADGRFVAEVDGAPQPLEVTLRGGAGGTIATVGREVLELSLNGSDVNVRTERKPVRVERQESANLTQRALKTRVSGTLSAPMPGRVVKVLVAPGAAVAKGAGLVVVEAMKMENELLSPRSGVVEKVFVAAGDAVERGAPLVEVR